MIKKEIKARPSFLKKYGTFIVLFELGLAGYAYLIYRRLNSSEGMRYSYSKNHPFVLHAYYEVGERLGGLDTRQTDQERWKTYERQNK
ncbi:hypothetical protein ACF0H5_002863 [Mactra antiquata]